MPIYEYECRNCGDECELLIFSRDEPVCPHCGSQDMEKKMSSFGFSVGGKTRSQSSGSSASCSGCTSSNCSSCH